jgi:hypothetical protein
MSLTDYRICDNCEQPVYDGVCDDGCVPTEFEYNNKGEVVPVTEGVVEIKIIQTFKATTTWLVPKPKDETALENVISELKDYTVVTVMDFNNDKAIEIGKPFQLEDTVLKVELSDLDEGSIEEAKVEIVESEDEKTDE